MPIALPRFIRSSLEGWFDMRDLGAVLDHGEPLPDPACDQVQWRRRIISAASPCPGICTPGA